MRIRIGPRAGMVKHYPGGGYFTGAFFSESMNSPLTWNTILLSMNRA